MSVLKRFVLACLLLIGMSGGLVAVASPASAIPLHARVGLDGDPPNFDRICIRVNVTIVGHTIGTGPEFICVP